MDATLLWGSAVIASDFWVLLLDGRWRWCQSKCRSVRHREFRRNTGPNGPEEASLWLPLDGGAGPDGLGGDGPRRPSNGEQLQTGAGSCGFVLRLIGERVD